MNDNEHRKNFRSDFELGKFMSFRHSNDEQSKISAQLIEESFSGMSCIVVTKTKIKPNDKIELYESNSWSNIYIIQRIETLRPNVYFLALSYQE